MIIDSNDRKEPELIDKGGVKIPKLDLSSIFIQREALPSNAKEESSDEDEDYYQEDGTEGEVDSKAKRDKFEQQKKEFKMRMMQGQKA